MSGSSALSLSWRTEPLSRTLQQPCRKKSFGPLSVSIQSSDEGKNVERHVNRELLLTVQLPLNHNSPHSSLADEENTETLTPLRSKKNLTSKPFINFLFLKINAQLKKITHYSLSREHIVLRINLIYQLRA